MKFNPRHTYLVIAVRVILGLFFIMSGVGGFYGATHAWAGVPADMIGFTTVLWNTGIFALVKGMEILAGFMLVVGFRPQLAALFLAPICIGATVVNAITGPQYIYAALFVTVLDAYLGYAYWDKYKQLFTK
ncbi:MAG TPA: DoxX family membrane protein [Verrucomicrobiae bacterium]|nr:DoxX family membrane protein [Verrucomicrobiae bacterium]